MVDLEKKPSRFSFLQSAQARIFMTLGIVVVVGVGAGIYFHYRSQQKLSTGSASVSGGASISSTPGAGNPSAAYVETQNLGNIKGEIAARKEAKSFVPTITRPTFVGDPSQFGANLSANKATDTDVNTGIGVDTDASKHSCKINKVVLMYKPNPASCTPKNLELARSTGVTAEELMCQGCSCPSLKLAGYTIGDLKRIGMDAEQLKDCGFSLQQLVQAGFSAKALKNAGFTATQLESAGFTPGELASAGFIAKAVKAESLASSTGQCSVDNLKKERANGISATALRQKGCGLKALKEAGFTARALRSAGFSAEQLKDAGFSASELKDAGFTAAQLKSAGYTAEELKNAGFSASQLKNAGFSAGQLVSAGFSPTELRAAGFTAKELRNAGLSASELREAGFGPNALKQAGFTNGDLLRAGFSPEEAGYQKPVAPKAPPADTSVVNNTDTAPTPAQGADSSAAGSKVSLPSIDDNTMEGRIAKFQKQQQQELNEQQREDALNQAQSLMMGQAQKFMTGWSNFGSQKLAKAPEEETKGKGRSEASSEAGVPALSKSIAGKLSNVEQGGPVIKAGSVMFAVLTTGINSDEQSPIMAQIVNGPLSGSRLLGSFKRVNQRLLLSFDLLSTPKYPKSITLNAVAIDPNTARTAISGSVNNHYLLRYGTLFASSFLEGVSNAIANQGVSTDCASAGGLFCIVKTSPLNTEQQIAVGLGKVGQQYATVMGENFNRAPTIRVASGSGIGVLVMSDLTLPPQLSEDYRQN